MTNGLVAYRLLVLLFLLFGLSTPTFARHSAASELSGTLLSVSGSTLSVQLDDGRAMAIILTPMTWFLTGGLPVSRRDFTPGEVVQIRLGRSGQALLVCDQETMAALDAQRGRLLTGTVLSSTPRLWIVQPMGNALPLPLCLTLHTTFSAAGVKVTAAAFNVGTSVTVVTRGLPNGLLSALSVSAAIEGEASGTEPKPRPTYLSGTVLEVRAERGLLLFQDKTGAARTVGVDAGTRIKVGRQPASLADIQPGMHLMGRLGTNADTVGNLIATSLSATFLSATVPQARKPRR